MPVDDPQNFAAQLRSQRKKVKQLDCKKDENDILDYLGKVKNKEDSTKVNHVSCLRILSDAAEEPLLNYPEKVPTDDKDEDDNLDDVIIRLSKKRGWTKGTQRNYEKSARVFLEFHGYHEAANEIEFTKVEEKEVKMEDTFSAEELKEVLTECARLERDRAMVYLLFETGARLSAILSLRVRDVKFGDGPGNSTLISFNEEAKGLKGADEHEVIIKPSEVFLENYITREHPDPENEDAPFFCVTKDHYDPDTDNSLIPSFFRRRLKRLIADSDIPDNKANPHNFRHSRVTQMRLEGYTDRQISEHMNWGPNSNQIDRYDHTSDKERHEKMADLMGLEVEDSEIREPMLDVCPGCNYNIDDWLNWSQCPRCHAQLKLYREPEWFEAYMELMDDDQNDPIYLQFLRNPHELYDEFERVEEDTRIQIAERVATKCREADVEVPDVFKRNDVMPDRLTEGERKHLQDDPTFRHD